MEVQVHDLSLEEALSAALGGDVTAWKRLLREQSWSDPVLALRNDRERERKLAAAAGATSLVVWLRTAARWVDELNRPTRPDPSPAQDVLRLTWQALSSRLTARLRQAREQAPLPDRGGVLAFVDGLSLCLVVNYEFHGASPKLAVIDVIEEPRSVFDVIDTLLRRPHETRNELKGILQSSHRLVWHRDVLVHVDRRHESRVFGPSIDTLHLAELIAGRYADLPPADQPASVLEVGTGSGFLSAAVLSTLAGAGKVVGVESDHVAAQCTHRNWRINTADRPGPLARRAALVTGEFRPDLLEPPFDLVICNPPYIPLHPGARVDGADTRAGAVAGLELLEELVAASPRLVAPGGSLLLVVSSVTPPERVVVPDGFELEAAWGDSGKEVLFEVEEIFSEPPWLQRLLEQGGLTTGDNSYVHRLHALWLRRSEEAA